MSSQNTPIDEPSDKESEGAPKLSGMTDLPPLFHDPVFAAKRAALAEPPPSKSAAAKGPNPIRPERLDLSEELEKVLGDRREKLLDETFMTDIEDSTDPVQDIDLIKQAFDEHQGLSLMEQGAVAVAAHQISLASQIEAFRRQVGQTLSDEEDAARDGDLGRVREILDACGDEMDDEFDLYAEIAELFDPDRVFVGPPRPTQKEVVARATARSAASPCVTPSHTEALLDEPLPEPCVAAPDPSDAPSDEPSIAESLADDFSSECGAPAPGSLDALLAAQSATHEERVVGARAFLKLAPWESLVHSDAASKERRRNRPGALKDLPPLSGPVRPLLQVFSNDATARYEGRAGAATDWGRAGMMRALEAMDRAAGRRIAPRMPDPAAVRALEKKFPNFAEVANDLADRLGLLIAASRAGAPQFYKNPNILLSGPPGIGKTAFCRAYARAVGIPFSILNCHASMPGMAISGVEEGFSTAKPGRIFEMLALHPCANPLLMIDELDKISLLNSHSPLGSLLAILEPETSEVFVDDFLGVPMDASGVNYIATANDLDSIATPLRSRFVDYPIEAPTPEQARVIAASIYEDTLQTQGWEALFDPTLCEDAVSAMLAQPPREMRAALERALARAVRAGRQAVIRADFSVPSRASTRPMGFL